MEENNIMNEVEEAVSEVDTSSMTNDELKKAVDETLSKVRNDAMILGFRVACTSVMQIVSDWRKPNCSHREYERIFKKVEKFCSKAMEQNEDSPEITVQN